MKNIRPKDKITFDPEKAVRKESERLAAEQARLDSYTADLQHAEVQLERLKARADELAALVPLGGATQKEVDDYFPRITAVEKTVAGLRKRTVEQTKHRDRAAAELERAKEQAREGLRAEAKRIAEEHMKRLTDLISEAVRANLAAYWLNVEMTEKGLHDVPRPLPMQSLLPTALQMDGGRAMYSQVTAYKKLLQEAWPGWNPEMLYDGGEISQANAMGAKSEIRQRLISRMAGAVV